MKVDRCFGVLRLKLTRLLPPAHRRWQAIAVVQCRRLPSPNAPATDRFGGYELGVCAWPNHRSESSTATRIASMAEGTTEPFTRRCLPQLGTMRMMSIRPYLRKSRRGPMNFTVSGSLNGREPREISIEPLSQISPPPPGQTSQMAKHRFLFFRYRVVPLTPNYRTRPESSSALSAELRKPFGPRRAPWSSVSCASSVVMRLTASCRMPSLVTK
jgi:hypothetical protein